jgi:hypothetical protein
MKHIGQHAIVIGASMGGLLAARAVGFLCRRHRPGARCVSAGGHSARFINRYIGKLHLAARYDAKLATTFLDVANLEAPPTRLLQPTAVMRVIRGNLGRGGGGTAATPARAQA